MTTDLSGPTDELDVGADPRWTPPWRAWSARRRAVAAGTVAALAVAALAGYVTLRPGAGPPDPGSPVPLIARAPGWDVTVPVPADPTRCPATTRCTTAATLTPATETAFRQSFPSAGYIGRARVSEAGTGRVDWQYLHCTTGTLVSVTLTQQPVELVAGALPPDHLIPTARDVDSGSLLLTVVRGGYLMTVQVAGLPGQALPVNSARRWLETVPAP